MSFAASPRNTHNTHNASIIYLVQKRFLSEDEKIEEVRLKKLKLRLKDEMEKLELQYRDQHHVA